MLARPAHTLSVLLTLVLCVLVAMPAGAFVGVGSDTVLTDLDGVVHVSWAPSPSPGVVGYHVYRGPAPSGPFTQISQTPVAGTTYRDPTVTDGQTYYYAATAVDAAGQESDLAAASNGILIAVDAEAPMVLSEAPFAGQGLPADPGVDTGRAVPAHSSIFVRLWDEAGVDVETVSVMVLANDVAVPGTTSTHPLVPDDFTDLFVRFVPDAPLPFAATVAVGLDATDVLGNGMATHHLSFQVETLAMHDAADAAAPPATVTELPDGDLLLSAGGVEVQYPATESQWIALAAIDGLPLAPGTTAVDGTAFLDQIQLYDAPITVRLPLSWEELNNFQVFQILRWHDDPSLGWQLATEGDGWLVAQQLVEQQLGLAGGYMELRINHAAGMTVVLSN